LLDSDDIIIDEVSVPSREDRRTIFAFFRARRPAQKKVNEAWRTSLQTRNYLGEWHTHPEKDPSKPSPKDMADQLRIVNRAKYEQESLFFIIVGTAALRVWEFARERNAPQELHCCNHEPTAPG
jgi:integrative and conjugative element protein (TIGR02256 family)